MTKTNNFDYALYRKAIAIYQYAERVVVFPNDTQNIEYTRAEAAAALKSCRDNNINWLPTATPCRGKKLAGKTSVLVTMNSDTNYGFSHYPDVAEKIYNILRSMWMAYIHSEEIDHILDLANKEKTHHETENTFYPGNEPLRHAR